MGRKRSGARAPGLASIAGDGFRFDFSVDISVQLAKRWREHVCLFSARSPLGFAKLSGLALELATRSLILGSKATRAS